MKIVLLLISVLTLSCAHKQPINVNDQSAEQKEIFDYSQTNHCKFALGDDVEYIVLPHYLRNATNEVKIAGVNKNCQYTGRIWLQNGRFDIFFNEDEVKLIIKETQE